MEKKSFEELEKEIRKLQPLKFRIQTPKNYKETIKLVINGTPTYLNSDKTPQCLANRSSGSGRFSFALRIHVPLSLIKICIHHTAHIVSQSR